MLELAASQAGALRTDQILQGMTRAEFHRHIRAGNLTRVHRSVWVLALAPDDLVSRLVRLQLCTPERIVAWGPTASALHEIWPTDPEILHITSLRARSFPVPADARCHQRILRSSPVRLNGVLVADYWDTAIDLALADPRRDCLAVLDAAAGRRRTTSGLQRAVRRAVGLRGMKLVRELAPLASVLAESPMESRVRQQIIQAGFTDVQPQLDVDLAHGRRRLDMGFRKQRVGIEYDGEAFHTGDSSLSDDRRRHNEFASDGWTMIHLTKRDAWQPARYLAQLALVLASRGYLPPDQRSVRIAR